MCELPNDRESEFRKICMLFISPNSNEEIKEIKDLIKKEKSYQHRRIRNRIIEPKSGAIAMVEKPVPLIFEDEHWTPIGDAQFERLPGQNVRQWPILFKHHERADTMYALKKNSEGPKNQWSYFVITRDGVITYCRK